MPKTVFMFSGQGSHYFQMGRPLFDSNPIFRNCMVRLDHVVREVSGDSVVDSLYSGNQKKGTTFMRTLLTHPAIFLVEYALAQTLIHEGIVPDVTLGASVGSFAAAAVAGFIDAEEALIAVIRQASLIEELCEPGGMIAVLASSSLQAEVLPANCEVAAVNSPTHFVVAAKEDLICEIAASLRAQRIAHLRLPVSYAFHSRWIDNAKIPFADFMESMSLKAGNLSMMCCDQAAVQAHLSPQYFWNVTRNPIRFPQAIARLEDCGANRYIDVGPSGTLATFIKYGSPIHAVSSTHSIMTPYGRDLHNLAELVATC